MTSKTDEADVAGEATGSGSGSADTLGYEQARDELIEVVRRLETGGTTLEESLALWERGEELAKVCRRWLDGARARLDAALAGESAGDDAYAASDSAATETADTAGTARTAGTAD
ncbi:exodeoxyribonuclease VII small subunit [Streptomyces sp. G5(2025)]|uniref:exodeoxyribonuclease VII small subunit n=1 Tax=Streptomyces sp. G5(2025) TaxID=3406628 RepID=UPI003C1E86BC